MKCMEAAGRFNQRAGGEYKLDIYPGEQLCKYAESIDSVRSGVVEMANMGWGGYAGTLPVLAVAEIPFLYESVQANAASQDGILEIYGEAFQKNLNQKALGNFNVTAMELISTKPIKTMDDFKGMVIQSDTPQGTALITALGASGTMIPFPEVYAALEKGVVDAAMLAAPFILISKQYEVAPNYTPCYALGTTHGVTINLDVWNKMPKNIQDILAEEIQQACHSLNEGFIHTYEEDMKTMADLGVEVYYLPKTERDKWKEVIRPYCEERMTELGEAAQKMKQIADAANSKYPYPY